MVSSKDTAIVGKQSRRRRLRKLCDVNKHPLKTCRRKMDKKFMEKLMRMKNVEEVVALAIRSREQGFDRDARIITGDVRDKEHTSHNAMMLCFEVARRSVGNSWAECKEEWVGNEEEGIYGWICVGAKKMYHEGRQVWLDEGEEADWIEGQCVCLQTRGGDSGGQRMIKYRYSVKNKYTDEVITLGSTCINNWGKSLTDRALTTFRSAVLFKKQTNVAKKWLYI